MNKLNLMIARIYFDKFACKPINLIDVVIIFLFRLFSFLLKFLDVKY